MKIKNLFFGAISVLPFSTVPIAVASCSNPNKKEVYLDINKISRLFLNRLSLNQIASLEKDKKIFYHFDKNGKHFFDGVKIEDQKMFLLKNNIWVQYVPDFPIRSNWKQHITDNDNIRIFDSNSKSNINDFLNEYTFDDVDSAGDFNDEWFSNLSTIYGKDFNRIRDPYFEDLQTIIFRLNQDIKLNFSTMNKRYLVNHKNEKTFFSDWIQPQYIQAHTFLSNEHKKQRDTFNQLLKLYLNKFNVDVARIDINWAEAEIIKSFTSNEDYISFKIKSIKDWNNNELLQEDKKNNKYYLNGFRSYATNGKFGVGLKGLNEELPLFSDYVENPLLYIDGKKYLTVIDNINHFIKSSTSPDYWNAKGLMYFFNSFKDEIFTIKIPEYKKDEDLEYKVIDFEFSDYFDTNQLFKAIVKVIKKDGSFQKYVWISSNFDDHGHRLKGMITNNKIPQEINPDDIYSFKPTNTGIPSGIKLEDFISNDPQTAFMQGLTNASNKMTELFNYWNNDSRRNFEASLLNNDSYQIKVFNSYVNNYLLAYALENKKGKTLSGIKRIDINLIPEKNKLGRLYFELKFIEFANDTDYKFINNEEKLVATASLYWNYFKGFDEEETKNDFTLINFEREK
ncbi:MAG3240 family lipoprotein [Metamycoplasma gateae]|uniref:Lipoprotein n=1 Tax=Metamycoplasma gateae TaxID=35769 RepID=A0ABZ2AHK9_9BACT|nr:hypothetical protein V2E26_01250 [Metamycoplasma gateae]